VPILEQQHTGLLAGGRFGDVDQSPQRLVLLLGGVVERAP
jgi:hypothetical protein